MGPMDSLQQLLQGQAMPAAQQAAPSPGQPGGGNQMIHGNSNPFPLTPDQQQLLSNFNIWIAQGKTLCNQLLKMGFEEAANACESELNRITKRKIQLQEELQVQAQRQSVMAMAQPQPGLQR